MTTTASLAAPTTPVELAANTLPSFYPGQGSIADFRQDPTVPRTDPEDWVASTTKRSGMGDRGLTRLPDGTLLADRFAADPTGWFGSNHVARHGDRAGLLVKLLDAGRRLPLHVHPTRQFAQSNLGSEYGKTEAWLVLDAAPGAGIQLGFSRDVSTDELDRWVAGQQVDELLSACNHVPVSAGDVLLCPAGLPHAIGAGVFMVELQEPTDLSIMLEWADYPIGEEDVFLGLPRLLALTAVNRSGLAAGALAKLKGRTIRRAPKQEPGITSLLPEQADEFFFAEQILSTVASECAFDNRFSVLVVNAGAGELSMPHGDPLPVREGQILLIPHAAGPITVHGNVSALRLYPN